MSKLHALAALLLILVNPILNLKQKKVNHKNSMYISNKKQYSSTRTSDKKRPSQTVSSRTDEKSAPAQIKPIAAGTKNIQ